MMSIDVVIFRTMNIYICDITFCKFVFEGKTEMKCDTVYLWRGLCLGKHITFADLLR